MLTGYNTDIKHEGVVYHVQTEDGGTENPVIVSLIYRGGRILASKKTSYAHLLGTEGMMARLRDMLEQQHRAMIKAILTGAPVTASGKPVSEPVAKSPTQEPAPVPPSRAPSDLQSEAPAPQTDKQPLEVPADTSVAGLSYVAWSGGNGNGHVKGYAVSVSDDGKTWGAPLVKGALEPDVHRNQEIRFPAPTNKKYIKFEVTDAVSAPGKPVAAIGELDVLVK